MRTFEERWCHKHHQGAICESTVLKSVCHSLKNGYSKSKTKKKNSERDEEERESKGYIFNITPFLFIIYFSLILINTTYLFAFVIFYLILLLLYSILLLVFVFTIKKTTLFPIGNAKVRYPHFSSLWFASSECVVYSYADSCRKNHNDTIIKTGDTVLWEKYVPLTLLKGFDKGYSMFYCERELETVQNCNISTPTLMAISVVSFSRSAQLEAQELTLLSAGFLYRILSLTHLDLQLTGDPEGPSAGGGFLYHIMSLTSLISNSDFLSSPSYIIVQSPTQSLEWHVWSSSSENNCHAVHRSLSSGASVYEGTMRFQLVPYFQPSPPTRFLLITAIGMCQILPVHHFGMAC